MNRKSKAPLADRVVRAAETALAEQDYASFTDVLRGIGWLDPNTAARWQRGQIDCLESAIQTAPPRLSEARRLFRSWAEAKGLSPSPAAYVARTPQRPALRFTRHGDPEIEEQYRTHWISPQLPEKKRRHLEAKASRAPDLVVIQPLNGEWKCHRCGGTGDFLVMEGPGPTCLRCAGLDDLEFLPSGDALLTRRVKAKSGRTAVVVRFSKRRGRYERQGLLVESKPLAETMGDLQINRLE
ncbi:MAG TPA: hypothetical protein VEC60_04430 [Reyranella sp.]|nr:hypothetical protein [Reyranella sp.]